MILTFGDIYESVLFTMGLNTSTVDANVATEIKRRINAVQAYIWYYKDWDWRKRRWSLTTQAPYETGTISVTKGSRSVTGSSTSWTDQHKLAYLRKDTNLYKTSYEAITTTTLKLKALYPEDTESGASYKLVFPDYVLPFDMSSLINVKYKGKDLRVTSGDKLVLEKMSMGGPVEAGLTGLSDETLYNDGTVTATNDSANITGSGTNWGSWMEGMAFQVNEFSEWYTIKSVTDTEHLVLKDAYQGDSGSGKGYKINPRGLNILTIGNIPDDYYWLDIEGLAKCKRLQNASDVSMIPNHAPLLHGAMWFAMTDMEGRNPVRIQQAKADFVQSMEELLRTSRTISGIQWTSEAEQQARRNGIGNYDPLSR